MLQVAAIQTVYTKKGPAAIDKTSLGDRNFDEFPTTVLTY